MRADVTQVLQAIEAGDSRASETLLPIVYDELRSLAAARLKLEKPGQTLQATALVHEAYLRLIGSDDPGHGAWDGRGHFFAAAAEAMRRIMIDKARAKGTAKRGGSWRRIDLDLAHLSLDEVPAELIELNDALVLFREEEPEKARLVELRFFAGLSMEQAAAVMGISTATAGRHWTYARAWLFGAMNKDSEKETQV